MEILRKRDSRSRLRPDAMECNPASLMSSRVNIVETEQEQRIVKLENDLKEE